MHLHVAGLIIRPAVMPTLLSLRIRCTDVGVLVHPQRHLLHLGIVRLVLRSPRLPAAAEATLRLGFSGLAAPQILPTHREPVVRLLARPGVTIAEATLTTTALTATAAALVPTEVVAATVQPAAGEAATEVAVTVAVLPAVEATLPVRGVVVEAAIVVEVLLAEEEVDNNIQTSLA